MPNLVDSLAAVPSEQPLPPLLSPRPTRAGSIFIAVWVLGISAAFWGLVRYHFEPGAMPTSPAAWPAGIAVPLDPSRPTIVLLAHPYCPCTASSLHELSRIAASAAQPIEVVVLFVRMDPLWEANGAWDDAVRIPGARVRWDDNGAAARALGATTSGHTLLVQDSRILFAGGITMSRAHQGDSPGRGAILSILAGEAPRLRETPVFGCPLIATTESLADVTSDR